MRVRHAWIKLRTHVYLCVRCGTGRVNAEGRAGTWTTTFYLPNGATLIDLHVPPCEPGPRTAAVFSKYAEPIAEWRRAHEPSSTSRAALG